MQPEPTGCRHSVFPNSGWVDRHQVACSRIITHNLCIIYVQYKSITEVDSHLGNWGLGTQVNGRSFPSPFQPAKQEKHARRARSMAVDKEEQIIRSLVWEGKGGRGG